MSGRRYAGRCTMGSGDTKKRRDWFARDYRDGDEQEINNLFNKVFDSDRSMEEWLWKFKGSYIDMARHISLIEDASGKIRGHYSSQLRLMSYFGKGLCVGAPGDTFIDQDFKKGARPLIELFKKQIEYAEGISVYIGYGFPNESAYTVGKRLLKYKDIGDIPVLEKELSTGAVFGGSGKLAQFGAKVARRVSRTKATGKGMGAPLSGWRLEDKGTGMVFRLVDTPGRDFNLFWRRVKDLHPITEIRTAQFLTWRYFERPDCSYSMITAEKEGELKGYVVIRNSTPEPRIAYVMDFFSERDPGLEAGLLHAAEEFAAAAGAARLRAWMHPSWLYAGSFHDAGFRNQGWEVKVVNIEFAHSPLEPVEFLDIRNWYFTMGSTDDL